MERFTELHAGVPVIKDKTRLKEVAARLHELEELATPKKVKTYSGTNRADCPVCGATVQGIGKPFGDYCSKCGQRLEFE